MIGAFCVSALLAAGCTDDNNEIVTIPTATTLASELDSSTSLTGDTIAVEIETELRTATGLDAEEGTETNANPDDPTGSSTGTTTPGQASSQTQDSSQTPTSAGSQTGGAGVAATTGADGTGTGGTSTGGTGTDGTDTTTDTTTASGGDTTIGGTVAPGSTAGASVSATGPLKVRLPSGGGLPQTSGYDVVTSGSGSTVNTGDEVWIHYEMVSWSNGSVVESTASDFGEPLILVIGDGSVPRILEAAVFQKPVGSRILVVFEEALVDLPTGFEPGDAYALAVDIVGP